MWYFFIHIDQIQFKNASIVTKQYLWYVSVMPPQRTYYDVCAWWASSVYVYWFHSFLNVTNQMIKIGQNLTLS